MPLNNLSVYSASAGSGKTYTIAYEYISMMLESTSYRNILAVTFTNKACEEMKSRIILNLYQISNVDTTLDPTKKKKTEDIIGKIIERTGLSRNEIISRSRNFFTQIIHDYSFFSVSTIDSFFQSIVRSMTYELDLKQNYELELQIDIVISQLVDDLMLIAEDDNESDLRSCIEKLIADNIDSDVSWSPKRLMHNFIKKALAEGYKGFDDMRLFDAYVGQLEQTVESFCKNYRECLLKIKKIVDSDLEHKPKASDSFFVKNLPASNHALKEFIYKTYEQSDDGLSSTLYRKWFNKGASESDESNISRIVVDFVENNDYRAYCTAYVVLKSVNLIRMLDRAVEILRDNLERDALFLLSDVPSLLSKIIEGYQDGDNRSISVMPFIFEKVGTEFSHFLIDEFQDTSRTQWDVFRTMLSEALASNNRSIIVGDIKQSIYSWRGGDWSILSGIEHDALLGGNVDKCGLSENHRTAKNIVEFNNDFFSTGYKQNEQYFGAGNESLYSDVKQKVTKTNSNSEVKVKFFEYEEGRDETKDIIFSDMLAEIENLQQKKGVLPSQITILVRTNPDATFIANKFYSIPESDRKPDVCYDVVSDEALYIVSNPAVRLIVAYMRSLLNPDDRLSLAEAAYIYYTEHDSPDVVNDFDNNTLVNSFNEVVGDNQGNIAGMQSFEIVDMLISRLGLNRKKSNVPFLIAFRNLVHDFSSKSTDLQAFVDYWDERCGEETLKIPENQDAIKIITVHASKGLEAEYVFVPFCNWSFDKKSNFSADYLYVGLDVNDNSYAVSKVDECSGNNAMRIPVLCTKQLEKTKFSDFYEKDLYRRRIESFNLLYVAFTRAKYGLYVSALRKKSGSADGIVSMSDVSDLLWNYFMSDHIAECWVGEPWSSAEYASTCNPDVNVRSFTCGWLADSEPKVKVNDEDAVIKEYPVCEKPEIGISHHLNENVEGGWSARVRGTKYHAIFENIETANDVERSVRQMFYNGEIEEEMVDSVIADISSQIGQGIIGTWFGGGCKVYNEFNIIDPASKDYKLKRPDRVMLFPDEVVILDYKFGEEIHNRTYAKQVLYYADLVSQMKQFAGMKVSSYIWYYFRKELVKVDSLEKIETINLNI